MYKLVLATVLMWLLPAAVYGQVLSVDLNKANLSWTWAQGPAPTDGMASEFRVKCGPSSNSYTRTTVIADPAARQTPIRPLIGGSGLWFCAVTAANKFGESGPSNEINFDAGAVPSNPANAMVTAQ